MPEPTTQLALVNQALAAIGHQQITSMTQANQAATYATLFYDEVRQEVLREAKWNFARSQITLTLLNSSPLVLGTAVDPVVWSFMPWSYEYAYPADCLRFSRIIPPYGGSVPGIPLTTGGVTITPQAHVPFTPWAEMNDNLSTSSTSTFTTVICCNVTPVQGEYTRDVTDPNVFDPGFRKGLIGRLANRLCQPLSGNLQLAQQVIAEGEAAIMAARAQDGNEGVHIQDHVPDFLRARGRGPWGPWIVGPGINGGGWGN